jgi:hypothetical protein
MTPKKTLTFFSKLFPISSTIKKSFLHLLYHKVAIWTETLFLNLVFSFWKGRYAGFVGFTGRL